MKDQNASHLPPFARALIKSLNFSEPDHAGLQSLSDEEWRHLLRFTDESQLTLLFGHLNRPYLPPWVADRIGNNYADNSLRFARLLKETSEIARELNQRSIPFALLKGFTHADHFIADPRLRSQGDIDLWCLPERVFDANKALAELGYRPIGKSRGRHLDPLIRESEWQWTGNYFAPDLPIPVDLHYQLWDRDMERLPGPVEKEVWERVCPVVIGNNQIAAQLHLTDAFAFACLHSLMHLLHGDLRLQRAWEIASFLQKYNRWDDFWKQWQSFYPEPVRRIQLPVLLLAHEWFGCPLPSAILEEAQSLPQNVLLWIERYAWSPVESLFSPNKDELWLNLSLLHSTRDKLHVSMRRLFPVHAVDGRTAAGDETDNGAKRRNSTAAKLRFMCRRAAYHLTVMPQTFFRTLRWWWACQQLGRDFLLFALASGIFDFGEFIFFVLYNLYLLQSGFDEKHIGQVAAALTAGTFVGAIPASLFMRKFGLRLSLQMAVAGTAVAGALRVVYVAFPEAAAGAFLNGASMAFWAVSLPPVVAGLSNTRNRTLAFSIVTAIGIGVGAIAGVAGASLPKFLMNFNPLLTTISAERIALLCGCAFVALSLLPSALLRVKNVADPDGPRKVYPRARFAWLFLSALFIWCLGTNGFNPLFNVYFAQHLHVGAQQIGFIFSVSQLAQVVAILLAPLLLRSLGQTVSIAALQVGTAALLVGLAFAVKPATAAVLYVSYMSFQYASEPCLLSMLMTGVRPMEQRGASALYFMVTSLAGVLAASAAGAVFQQLGYQPALLACAVLAVIGAVVLYRATLRDRFQIVTPK